METIYPSTLPRISPSSVGSLDCSRRFHELYIKRNWPPRKPVDTDKFALGTAVHDVLSSLHRVDGSQVSAESYLALARAAVWKCEWPDCVDKAEAAQRVLASALGFVAYDAEDPEPGETLSVEWQSEFVCCHQGVRFVVSAKVDKIIARGDHLVARNYKTSRPRIDLKQAFLELWVAKKMFPGYASYSLEYLFLDGENNVHREAVTERDLRGIHALVMQAAVAALSSPDHAACPGATCDFCPIRATCDARSVIGARPSVREA